MKVSRLKKEYFLAAGLALVGIILITIPDLINHFLSNISTRQLVDDLQESLYPRDGKKISKEQLNTADLIAQLQEADRQWHPREEFLVDGSTRYSYKRREGEPDLTLTELKHLVESPPTFQQEQEGILQLLDVIRRAGVNVVLAPTLKKGAAAEWDHRLSTLRIQPNMAEKGSLDFLRVLNHEAIHVAQSCKAGTLKSRPKALGIHLEKSNDLLAKIKDPVYSGASAWEQQLEMEAYSLQNSPTTVEKLLTDHCLPA